MFHRLYVFYYIMISVIMVFICLKRFSKLLVTTHENLETVKKVKGTWYTHLPFKFSCVTKSLSDSIPFYNKIH